MMNKLINIVDLKKLAFLSLSLVIAGCSGGGESMAELQNYATGVINRAPGAVEPLPEFISYEAFSYSAAGLRGPFDVPVDVSLVALNEQGKIIQPDENRERESLEEFAISTLRMVGSLSRGNTLWVLIQDENSAIHRVEEGGYLGKNHGKIVTATNAQLDIVEIVPSGSGGWIERPQTISLESLEEE